MIRRKLTRIELQLDDTKELEDLFNRPIITQYNLSAHRAFQNPSAIEKQLQSDLTSNFTIASQQQQQQQQDGNQVATTSGVNNNNNNNNNNTSANESIGYNPQPYNNSSTRFQQFNKSGIR
jgi:hypothetical protein